MESFFVFHRLEISRRYDVEEHENVDEQVVGDRQSNFIRGGGIQSVNRTAENEIENKTMPCGTAVEWWDGGLVGSKRYFYTVDKNE